MPGRKAHSCRSSSWICRASSRVGARMRPVTAVPSGSVCSTMGMPKAKVLPEPVGALAMTSFQSLKQGMAPAWTGVAWEKPFCARAFMMPSERCISLYRRSSSTSMPLISIKTDPLPPAEAGGIPLYKIAMLPVIIAQGFLPCKGGNAGVRLLAGEIAFRFWRKKAQAISWEIACWMPRFRPALFFRCRGQIIFINDGPRPGAIPKGLLRTFLKPALLIKFPGSKGVGNKPYTSGAVAFPCPGN